MINLIRWVDQKAIAVFSRRAIAFLISKPILATIVAKINMYIENFT
jgi:hypothetical protein